MIVPGDEKINANRIKELGKMKEWRKRAAQGLPSGAADAAAAAPGLRAGRALRAGEAPPPRVGLRRNGVATAAAAAKAAAAAAAAAAIIVDDMSDED